MSSLTNVIILNVALTSMSVWALTALSRQLVIWHHPASSSHYPTHPPPLAHPPASLSSLAICVLLLYSKPCLPPYASYPHPQPPTASPSSSSCLQPSSCLTWSSFSSLLSHIVVVLSGPLKPSIIVVPPPCLPPLLPSAHPCPCPPLSMFTSSPPKLTRSCLPMPSAFTIDAVPIYVVVHRPHLCCHPPTSPLRANLASPTAPLRVICQPQRYVVPSACGQLHQHATSLFSTRSSSSACRMHLRMASVSSTPSSSSSSSVHAIAVIVVIIVATL